MKKQFKQLLTENTQVTPGKPLNDVSIFFLGRECFTNLSEEDKHVIYSEHQRHITEHAKLDFQELLLENLELFSRCEFDDKESSAEISLEEIQRSLKDDNRFVTITLTISLSYH